MPTKVKKCTSPAVAKAFVDAQRALRIADGYAPGKGKAGSPGAKAQAAKASAKSKGKAKPAPVKPEKGVKRRADSASGEPAKRAKGADGTARGRTGGGGSRKVDPRCPKVGLKVYEDYSVTLNQTNVGANNNKFYIIQVLHGDGKYYAWNRWGRVGDEGQNKLEPCATPEQAIKLAKSKFRSKSGNDWNAKDHFVAKKGLYTLVETDESSGGGAEAPMGKLTEPQINKGQAVLDKLLGALNRKVQSQVTDLSSQFYSLIPHNFGWKKPVAITSMDMLNEKQELLKFYLRMGFEKVEAAKGATPIDGLLDLPVPKTLAEAAAGICAATQVTNSNKKGRELLDKNAGKPRKPMTEAMYGAIMLYTSNAIYAELNRCLRDSNRVKIKRFFKYLRLLLEAMDSLKGEKATLWRGLSVDLFSDPSYEPGKTVTWWGVSSCTSNMQVARGFAGSCGSGASVITVHSKSACDISAISFYGNEKESLLRPGTMLKVKSRTKKGNITDIVLEEVGSAIK